MLVGDFNADKSEPCLLQFLYEYNARNIVKGNTYFKNALNPSCIDPFVTNSPLSFQNTIAISNELSDFHKMVITVMAFKKHSLKERHYRYYKYLIRPNLRMTETKKLRESITNYASFKATFIEVLSNSAPLRKKFFRASHAIYMTKTLSKAIMRRSQLETKHLKAETKTDFKLCLWVLVLFLCWSRST